MGYKVLNNAFSTLAGSLSAIATSLTVNTGHGDRFPVISGADYTYITLEDASGNIEIVKVTARSTASDVMTIEREQDGTVARSWAAGDIVELRVIAALLDMAIAHVDDTSGAHTASAITNVPSGSVLATNLQAAVNELDADIAALSSSLSSSITSVSNALTTHINDTSDAHDASAISYAGGAGVSADNVEGAIDELATEKANVAGQTFTGPVIVPDGAYDASSWNGNSEVPTKNAVRDKIESIAFRGYISGLTMSTAGASTTMTIGAGQAADSASVITMNLAAPIAKTTSAWTVGTGNGGIDTGAIANTTWYHFYLIRRPDTGVVDVIFSLSASSPTLPANYTQYRRIGSGRTNGSAQWIKFIQFGDYFDWDATVLDVNSINPGTAAATRTLTVPTGVQVIARFNGGIKNGGTGVSPIAYFSPLDISDEAPSETAAPLGGNGADASVASGGARFSTTMQMCRTNTSAQIRSRINGSDGNITFYLATLGWIDSRGKD